VKSSAYFPFFGLRFIKIHYTYPYTIYYILYLRNVNGGKRSAFCEIQSDVCAIYNKPSFNLYGFMFIITTLRLMSKQLWWTLLVTRHHNYVRICVWNNICCSKVKLYYYNSTNISKEAIFVFRWGITYALLQCISSEVLFMYLLCGIFFFSSNVFRSQNRISTAFHRICIVKYCC
jgi:hypothetical protein